MNFKAALSPVFNRGPITPGDREHVSGFLAEMVEWAKTAPDRIFAPNAQLDIYDKVKPELGPWTSLVHRKAVMLEVMRVLAGFESSWDWKEGVDTSRLGANTAENAEAGAWQVSYDARNIAGELQTLLIDGGVHDGVRFQQEMKLDHPLAMAFVATLMRYTTKHNGPLYKGEERAAIRSSLRSADNSIYPWLSRESVAELQAAIES